MHGRLKVRTTEGQQLIKQKEQQKKLAFYRQVISHVASHRYDVPYEETSFVMSAQILSVNPDVYTLWNYRKEVIQQLAKESKENDDDDKLTTFLENEIKLTEQCLINNPKSYSSWHHRYWILQQHPNPNWEQEFNICTKYLTIDDRNFHVWDYRRLIINKVGITLSDELAFSTDRIIVNFSNYSSWHYRSTLRKLDKSSLAGEKNLVENAVFTDPNDSSAWFYLRWVLSHPDVTDELRENLLFSFKQLFALDPDCKWILMARCWLTGSLCLNDKNVVDNRVEHYNTLIKLDPMRKGQYEDYLTSQENLKTGDHKAN